jgi:hypothetical protein
VQTVRLRHTGGSLQLSGHRYESVSAYEWTTDTQAAVGGTVFTVEDDIHGSALREPGCAAHIVAYLITGRADRGGCQGVPMPSGPQDSAAGPRLADTTSLTSAMTGPGLMPQDWTSGEWSTAGREHAPDLPQPDARKSHA